MPFVLVLYYSHGGSTKNLAYKIAQGIEKQGLEARLRTVPQVSPHLTGETHEAVPHEGDPYVDKQDLSACAGLALGSPTRFGNMSAAMKYFLDGTTKEWLSGTLNGKPACVFTSTSTMHGGQESTLLSMMLPLMHHGMIICGLPYSEPALHSTQTGGTPYGVSHVSGANQHTRLSAEEAELCVAQGQRIATIAQELYRQ